MPNANNLKYTQFAMNARDSNNSGDTMAGKSTHSLKTTLPMSSSPYAYQHYLLRSISTQLKLPETAELALRPGVQSVYRVTCFYPDDHVPNSVATLLNALAMPTVLQLHYEHATAPRELPADAQQVKALATEFSSIKFDKLPDQPDIPVQGVTLWLIERAAGSFLKSVLVAPELAADTHLTLIHCLNDLLPQAVAVMGEW